MYGQAAFIPRAIRDAVHVKTQGRTTGSLIQEKHATPAEPIKDIREWDRTVRPDHIVAERSVKSQSNIHDNYRSVFAKYGTFEISSGNVMVPQFHSWYLGMAHPFTIPSAVGGYDVPNQYRWRRPEDEDIASPRSIMPDWLPLEEDAHSRIGTACNVKLFDITRGLPQRIEGQFRRHWGLAPALWNLYFREQINLGASLSVKQAGRKHAPNESLDEDAAMAAAKLLEKLEKGYYEDRKGKKRKIDGDYSKLLFSTHLTDLQRKLLTDFRFRCKTLPGTQEIRTKIGHLGFWASVVYGNGIFMTVSPGERHNYLAIRLSRYRKLDPFMQNATEESKWAQKDAPRSEPDASGEDEFHINIPGYDLRRLMLAQDPLAACNAFVVQIRVILATVLGIRMCPHCPHCASTDYPCQDAFGSSAELLGGLAGRADALFGAVECQKSNGSLHYHFFVFIQRLHQYASMKEIAEKLEAKLVEADELKGFLANICCESYPNKEKFLKEMHRLEENFPTYSEKSECGDDMKWGSCKLGRLPAFLYGEASSASTRSAQAETDNNLVTAESRREAEGYKAQFEHAFQYFQSRCQHHIHKLINGKRVIPNACRSKAKPTECKHEAPWTNRVSPPWMERPLLVSKLLFQGSLKAGNYTPAASKPPPLPQEALQSREVRPGKFALELPPAR